MKLLITILLTFSTPIANAGEFWQSYQIWAGSYQMIQTPSKATTQQALEDHVNSIGRCLISTTLSSDQPNSIAYTLIYRNAGCSTGQNQITITFSQQSASCPASLPHEWSDGICYSEPEPALCPDGQFDNGNGCEHGCVAGAEVKLVLPMEQVQSSTIDPILGCDLNMSETKKPECNFNTLMCNVYYTDSGEYNDLFDADPEYEPLPEPDPIPEPVSSEEVTGPVVDIQQNPDGSTTKTETTEITKLNDQGQTLEIIGDSIVLKNKDGEIIDILQQTTTNTYTDGSSSVTETTTTTATPSAVTEVKKNLSDGSTSVTTRTYQSGPSGTTVTTKTETFDPQGNSTGKTESTTGKIDEVGEEEDGDYSYQSPGGKDDLYEKSGKTFQGVLTNFVDEAQQAPVFSAASGFFTVSTGGTCPTWTIPATWVFSAMVIDAQCSPVMNQIWPLIAAIVLAVAGYVSFRWAFL